MADLERFVTAQEPVIADVQRELGAGRKTSHWMWFVFPQIAGLGSSPTTRFYALESVAEARAYLVHPVLGPRLLVATRLVLGHAGRSTDAIAGRSANAIFGSPDDLKFRSCMTLFSRADPGQPVFGDALSGFFGGDADPLTLDAIRRREVESLGGDGV